MKKKLLSKLIAIVLLLIPLLMMCDKTCIAAWTPVASGTSEDLNAVWGSSESDVFAVGKNGTILHYNGTSWSSMDSGSTQWLMGVWGSSGSDVFAVGDDATIIHYNGTSWSPMANPTTEWLTAIWGSSGSDVFTVGVNNTILHYNGTSWSPMDSGSWLWILGVWGSSGSDVFAVGSYGNIVHYDGSTWSTMTSPITSVQLNGVWGSSGNDVFVAGTDGTIIHYNGSDWSPMASGSLAMLQAVWGSSGSDVFAVGTDGAIIHYNGSDWSPMLSGTSEPLRGTWGSSGSDVFAVGDDGTILHYDGVECQSDSDCDDGLYCNGTETCDSGNETCLPGTPVSCPDGQICDEDSNQCMIEPCTVTITPPSATVFTWETVQFSTTLDGACNEPCYTWEIAAGGCTGNTTGSTIGSTIDANGLYMTDGMAGTDVVRVTDACNGNICDSATVHVMTTTTTIPCIPDDFEPDDFPDEANPIVPDSCQYHSICPEEDFDWVEFELTAESGVTLETFGSEGDIYMGLFENYFQHIAFGDFIIQQPCLSAGTYYLGIAGYADGGTLPEYEVCLTLHPCPPPVELDCDKLLASSQFGELFRIDVTNGAAEFIGYMHSTLATEIEYDVLSETLYAEEVSFFPNLHTINPGRGTSTGFVEHDYGSLNGLEFVDSTLYGTFISFFTEIEFSELVIVDTTTGDLTHIGPTGFGPISGLAYDKGSNVMYGITAGGSPADLVTIDLTTGAATVVGPTGLDRIGSIEFGPDGNLYGGVTAFGSSLATYLVRIDTATGAVTPVGETGFSITGLTSCQAGVEVLFDIKPDPLNLKCKGVLPAAILGTDELDVKTIDPDSLRLTREGTMDGVAPIRYNFTDKEAGDMLLKFRVPEVVEVLMLDELAGQTIPLTITGRTVDGAAIRGQDTVRLLGNIDKECHSDFDCDADVDGSDAITFTDNFGRNSYEHPCSDEDPCDGNYDKDRDVDGNDAITFKADFGTNQYWYH